MAGRRSPSPSAPDRAVTALPLLGAAVALLGVVLLLALLGGPRLKVAAAGSSLSVGGLRLSVEEAAWVGHDMASMGPMPMDGMPAPGAERIHLKVLVVNPATKQQTYSTDDFRLAARSGKSWRPQRSTMPSTTILPAGSSMVGDLYFEVPRDQRDLRLSLSHGRERAIVDLSLPGATTHDHGEDPER